MKVSVLISVYNPSILLLKAIKSVCDQTYRNWEIILINDGSTDLEVLNRFPFDVEIEKILLINKRNTGLTDSLNFGIKYCNGELIARLDDDDYWEPEKLLLQVDKLYRFKLDLVASSFTIRSNDNSKIKEVILKDNSRFMALKLLTLGRTFPHSSVLFKKSKFHELGGYCEFFKRAQDRDLWIRIARKGKIGIVSEMMTNVIVRDNSISRSEQQIVFSMLAKYSGLLKRDNSKTNDIELLHYLRSKYNITFYNRLKKFSPVLSYVCSMLNLAIIHLRYDDQIQK